MDSDWILVMLVAGIAFYILFRILSLRKWMMLNIEMKKGSRGKYNPSRSGDYYHEEYERSMRLKKHRLALRKARDGKKL
jgi:hypothetical protein